MNRDANLITGGPAVVVRPLAEAASVLPPSRAVRGRPRREFQGDDGRRVTRVWRGARQSETCGSRPATQTVCVSPGTWRRCTEEAVPPGPSHHATVR